MEEFALPEYPIAPLERPPVEDRPRLPLWVPVILGVLLTLLVLLSFWVGQSSAAVL